MAGEIKIITGSDEYAVKTRLRAIALQWSGDVIPEENNDWDIIRGDDGVSSCGDILMACAAALRTPPFFSPTKTVFLVNFAGFPDLDSAPGAFNHLMEVLKPGLPDNIRFLAGGAGLDGRKAAAKALKNCPGADLEILNLPDPKRKDSKETMRIKLEEYAAANGKRLDMRAQEFLLAAVGTDTALLYTELDKLFTWQGDEDFMITADDLRETISATGEAPGWELAEALRNRDLEGAFRVMGKLMRQLKGRSSSGNELSLFYTAAGAFEDILRTKAEMYSIGMPDRFGANYFQNISEEEKNAHPGCSLYKIHPFRAFKLCEAARSFSASQLSSIFSALLEANVAMVNGSGTAAAVLEKMIRKICSAR